MSDPSLLAILFVSSSSKGSHLVFRWPTRPQAVRRLARPKPITRQLDYAWRAAHPTNNTFEPEDRPFSISTHGNTDALGLINDSTANKSNRAAETGAKSLYDDDVQNPAYEWKLQEWGGHIGSRDGNPGSTAPSPQRRTLGAPGGSSSRRSTNAGFTGEHQRDPDFDWVLGYKTKLLAEHVFRFDRNLCNQRFELILEELLFLGHPVCIGDDGTWQWEQLYSDPKQKKEEERERGGDRSATGPDLVVADPKNEASLKSFHFILVLDRPDPALGGNANLTRFVDVYYEQLAVKMTAALHYEQSRDGYVEKETDLLVDLMESSESYRDFMDAALEKSSLARAIREIFVGVQNQRLAHVTVGEFELDLQMPWYHSELLLGEQDPEGAGEYSVEDERDERWDPGFGKGWRVKRLLPWNTLLFLEGWELGSTEAEPDEMTKFRDVLTPDISLADAAALLDWDLEKEVMRMARYMIYLKKAKVCDVVHPKLLNIYVLPARSTTTLSDLSRKFQYAFPPTTPALETILAAISASPQAFAHFVPSDDHAELYHQILIWLLKNDALIMLHVRFRLVATSDVKRAVHKAAQKRKNRVSAQEEERGRKRKPSGLGKKETEEPQRLPPPPPTPPVDDGTEIDLNVPQNHETSPTEPPEDDPVEENVDNEDVDIDVPDHFEESFIMEPGRATPLEQAWIGEIARRNPDQQKRFLLVCQYFDGRTSFDEIQYRSQLKRKHFRNIVVAYDDWVSNDCSKSLKYSQAAETELDFSLRLPARRSSRFALFPFFLSIFELLGLVRIYFINTVFTGCGTLSWRMRAKDLWEFVPYPEKIRNLYARLTSNGWTKAFCLLAALHCAIQIGLQSGAYANNHATASSFEAIVSNMTLTPKPFAILENNGDLTLCTNIPQRFGGPDQCERFSFNGSSSPARVAIFSRRFTASLELKNGTNEIELEGLDGGELTEGVDVGPECISTFPWVFDVIHNATREDLVFVLFQVWLLGVSLAALFKESIPHLATALASETLATVWAAYKVARTKSFKMDFARIVTSTCGINVLPDYFGYRDTVETNILASNILALLGFLFLSWKLYKEYAPRMLKRVDFRPDMERLYRVTLSLSTVIHLAAFFLLTVSGLFIDQLLFGRIRLVAQHVTVYEVIFILLIALLVPWVAVGLVSTRKESRWGMVLFIFISLAFLAVWGVMFASQIYRFMFSTWAFFATMSIFACLLLVTVVCLSVYAFLNFGLGLPEYLQTPLMPHPADKIPWMIESGIDTEPPKSKENMRMGAMPGELAPPVSNHQTLRISILSGGSAYSLDTTPSQTVVEPETRSNSARSRLAKPIVANLTLPTSSNDSNDSLSDSTSIPPGLTVPPRKPSPAQLKLARLLVPPSRWSATTASSAPSIPPPISATGDHLRNQSRWSASTTTTYATSTSGSGGRLSEVPPVPSLPISRVPSSEEASSRPESGSESGHRNVM